jgi:hypothetical protein
MQHSRMISLSVLSIILGMVIADGVSVSAHTVGFLSVKGTWITDSAGKPALE